MNSQNNDPLNLCGALYPNISDFRDDMETH